MKDKISKKSTLNHSTANTSSSTNASTNKYELSTFKECPDCPTEGVKVGTIYLASDYNHYVYTEEGKWEQTLPTATLKLEQRDAFSPSNPWWQPSGSDHNIESIQETGNVPLPKTSAPAEKKIDKWPEIENVLENKKPIDYHNEDYIKEYNRIGYSIDTVANDTLEYFRYNCFHAAKYQVELEEESLKGPKHAIQMVVDNKLNPNLKANPAEGTKYIKQQLLKGRPVLIGLSHGDELAANHNKLTQHFVVIVGMGYDEKEGNYFSFYDNGFSPWDDLKVNRYYWNSKTNRYDRRKEDNEDYVTEVRRLKDKD